MKKLTALLCAVLMLLSLTACGEKSGSEAVVAEFCKAVKAFDTDTMESLLLSDEKIINGPLTPGMPDTDIIEDFCARAASKIKYKIISSDEYSDSSEVSVRMQYRDAANLIRNVMNEYGDSSYALHPDENKADAAKFFDGIFEKNRKEYDIYKTESIVYFNCTLTADGWKIDALPEDMRNIVTSNMSRTAPKPAEYQLDAFFETGPYVEHDFNESYFENPVWNDVPMGEKASLKIGDFTVLGREDGDFAKSDYDYVVPQTGAKFTFFLVEIENSGFHEDFYISSSDILYCDDQGRMFRPDDRANMCMNDSALYVSLKPGEPVSGKIAFNIPEDSEGGYLIIHEYDSYDYFRLLAE